MLAALIQLPLFVILMGASGALMFVPVAYGLIVHDIPAARLFFYSGLLTLILTGMLGVATYRNPVRNLARSHLTTLVAAYVVLPALLAVPFYEVLRTTTFLNAYFEMVSSFTTTGASIFDPERLTPTLHLWRALVGWVGGFFIWVTVIAILAPMNLGGFEVTSVAAVGDRSREDRQLGPRDSGDTRIRLLRYSTRLLPVYLALTGALALVLLMAGDRPLVAVSHAMSTLATSGISPVGGVGGASSGFVGEALIFIFFFFAISRQTFTRDFSPIQVRRLSDDPEINMGLYCVILVPTLLFLRHWIGAYEVNEVSDIRSALLAFWGSAFTVLSFLSTTGFESANWETARAWSGLQTPGLILMGLALVGGGVATTAGGVKLMRVYALYKHGRREMERLVHPSSIGGAGVTARRIRRQGAYVAWIFFMLFALSLALVAMLLSLAGLEFDEAMALSIAALSTTGPVTQIALEQPIDLADFSVSARVVLCAAMVLGRLETLALIALLNPEFWRN